MKHQTVRSIVPAALAATLALSAGLAAAADPKPVAMTEAQVRAKLQSEGYTKVNDVEFADGVWKADARSADGNRVNVRIDPATGAVYPNEQVAQMSEKDVRAALSAQGYTHVHDVDYEDGVWNAEGDDPSGKDMELKIDPNTGKVIGKEKD